MDNNREEAVRLWQERLENTFSGPNNIIGEKSLIIDEHEKMNSYILNTKLRGFTVIMDSFFDFYIGTLREINSRESENWNELLPLYTTSLIMAFWRLKASYNIFWQGYFFDATSLLRSVFEIAMENSALHWNIIEKKDVLLEIPEQEGQNLSEEERRKRFSQLGIKVNKKISNYIIGNQSGLSNEARATFIVFKNLLHKTIHNSKLAFYSHYGAWRRRGEALPFLPSYNEEHATLYTNYTAPICWMIVRVLFLLQTKQNEFSAGWQNKYKVMDESFRQATMNMPNKDWHIAFEELISKKFTFTLT